MAGILSALGTFNRHVQVFGLALQYLPLGASYPPQALGAALPFGQQQSFGFPTCEMPDSAGYGVKPRRMGMAADGALLGCCSGQVFRNTRSGWKVPCFSLMEVPQFVCCIEMMR